MKRHDAKRLIGTPVEIKAAMHRMPMATRSFKRFDLTRTVRAPNGLYVFGTYRVCGRGVKVLEWEMRHSSRLPQTWLGRREHESLLGGLIGDRHIGWMSPFVTSR